MKDFEKWCNRAAVVFLILFAAYFFWMIFLRPSHLPVIQEVTPAERKQVYELSRKYKLAGYVWMLNRDSQEISYYRNREWRVVK